MNIADAIEPRFLLDAAQTIVIVLLWLRKPGLDAAQAVGALAGRVDVLDERLKHMPSIDELTELEGTVKAIEAKLEGMSEGQVIVRNTVARIETYLLTHKT